MARAPKPLDEIEIDILRNGAKGIVEVRSGWIFLLIHKARLVTGKVRRLEKRGLVEITYYSNGASVWATDAGREYLKGIPGED